MEYELLLLVILGSVFLIHSTGACYTMPVITPQNLARLVVLSALSFVMAGCADTVSFRKEVGFSQRVVGKGQPVPKGGGHRKIGKPYQIAGKWYRPRHQPNYDRVGMASWYGDLFHGRKTANGEIYDMGDMTAAHPTLPLPSIVRVTNLANGKSVVVRVNDRGPYKANRVIDLSKRASDVLGYTKKGIARVRVQFLRAAPLTPRVAGYVKRAAPKNQKRPARQAETDFDPFGYD